MIRLPNYKQPMTGVSLPWWEIQSVSIRRDKMVKDKNGQHQHLPLDFSRSTAVVNDDHTFYYTYLVDVTYGGYAVEPSERIMPIAIHTITFTKEEGERIYSEAALEVRNGLVYGLIDELTVVTIEMFKGGEAVG